MVETQLGRNPNSKFLVGDTLTIADFSMAQTFFNIVMNAQCGLNAPFEGVMDSYPKVKAYYQRLKEELDPYLSTRPAKAF